MSWDNVIGFHALPCGGTVYEYQHAISGICGNPPEPCCMATYCNSCGVYSYDCKNDLPIELVMMVRLWIDGPFDKREYFVAPGQQGSMLGDYDKEQDCYFYYPYYLDEWGYFRWNGLKLTKEHADDYWKLHGVRDGETSSTDQDQRVEEAS